MKFNNKTFIPYKDQFNYYNLIKKINPSYRLYFDRKSKEYFIININRNFEMCAGFISFYENILHDLRFSKVENFSKILEFIEEENSKLANKNNEKNYLKNKSILTNYQQISNRSSNINKKDINKIIGAAQC